MRGAAVSLLLLYNDVDSGKNSFLEWLLNHDNESTTEGRIAKYQIVNTMLSLCGSFSNDPTGSREGTLLNPFLHNLTNNTLNTTANRKLL